MENEEVLIDAPRGFLPPQNEPPMQELDNYRCPTKRHSYSLPVGSKVAVLLSAGLPEFTWISGDICPQCFVEGISQLYPTERVVPIGS